MTRAASTLVFLAAAAVLAGPAAADSRTVKDPRGDTKGSHYPGAPYVWSTDGCWVTKEVPECGEDPYFEDHGPYLDIASVGHAHKGALLAHRLALTRKLEVSRLGRGGGGQISLYFNLNRNPAFERRLDVHLRRGKLAATMRAGSRSVGKPTVARPNGKTIEIRFARSALGRGPLTYRWFAFAGIECRREYNRCGDRSPNAALVRHRLR